MKIIIFNLLIRSYFLRKKIGITADSNAIVLKLKKIFISKLWTSKRLNKKNNKKEEKMKKEKGDLLFIIPTQFNDEFNFDIFANIFYRYKISFSITCKDVKFIPKKHKELYVEYKKIKTTQYDACVCYGKFDNLTKKLKTIFIVDAIFSLRKDLYYASIYSEFVIPINKHKELFLNNFFKNNNFKAHDGFNKTSEYVINKNAKLKIVIVLDRISRGDETNLLELIDCFRSEDLSKFKITIFHKGVLTVYEKSLIKDYTEIIDFTGEIDYKVFGEYNYFLNLDASFRRANLINKALSYSCLPLLIGSHKEKANLHNVEHSFIKSSKVIKSQLNQILITSAENIAQCLYGLDFDKYTNTIKLLNRKKVENSFDDVMHASLDGLCLIKQSFNNYIRTDYIEKCDRPSNIDLLLTSYKRFEFFEDAFNNIKHHADLSKHKVRVHVVIDNNINDPRYFDLLRKNNITLFSYEENLGLPFIMNSFRDMIHRRNKRLPLHSDFIAYFQDDTCIFSKENYFDKMVAIYNNFDNNRLGFISGFFNEIHPGYQTIHSKDGELRLSNSIDGKNFFCDAKFFLNIKEQPDLNKNSKKYGNPSKYRGSNFDIWLWNFSGACKNKVNLYWHSVKVFNDSI